MSTNPDPPVGARSSVRVSRIRGGEYIWTLHVGAERETADALRAAVALVQELDVQLATAYPGKRERPRVHVPTSDEDDDDR